MKKLLFVYNPRSGKGLIRNSLSSIVETFSAGGYDVTIYPTKCERDACDTVQSRAAEFDMIVCSGGDGTLNNVVSGLMALEKRPVLGYLPSGSTNDYARSLEIPGDPREAAEVALTAGER